MSLDAKIAELAEKYRPLAVKILEEAIRIPADYVDKDADQGGDPECGLSNHEGPRLAYLKAAIIENGSVARPEDVDFDEYGNLVWSVQDADDGVDQADKKVIYLDGHTDTVRALREQWTDKIGKGMDAYDGLTDESAIDREFLERELGHLPPQDEWKYLVFGRGAADQLSGVVAQIISTKIMLELRDQGALKGAIVRSYATTAEEDNDGGGPMYVTSKVWPNAGSELIPDVVILTEGTGDAQKGAVGIYRGQRGRMQIEVTVTGRSCHGSMPWEGLNPLEFGGAILAEAAKAYDARKGFKDDAFLGHGTRTASWAKLETPSDCAVPDKLIFRFDRRLTAGESPEQAVADVDALESVAKARAAGLRVDILVPRYEQPTWTGYNPGNSQIYPGWVTPEDHPAIECATEVYRAVVTPHVKPGHTGGALQAEPRVDRWIFSTDGVGFPIPLENKTVNIEGKRWVEGGVVKHPAMFGCGPGIEQNTHKIGECVDSRELQHAIAFIARYPSAYAAHG
jgi:putative selenium metabolism hydrolase